MFPFTLHMLISLVGTRLFHFTATVFLQEIVNRQFQNGFNVPYVCLIVPLSIIQAFLSLLFIIVYLLFIYLAYYYLSFIYNIVMYNHLLLCLIMTNDVVY